MLRDNGENVYSFYIHSIKIKKIKGKKEGNEERKKMIFKLEKDGVIYEGGKLYPDRDFIAQCKKVKHGREYKLHVQPYKNILYILSFIK